MVSEFILCGRVEVWSGLRGPGFQGTEHQSPETRSFSDQLPLSCTPLWNLDEASRPGGKVEDLKKFRAQYFG